MPYSASIFIWYPDEKEGKIGHCSMYIGDLFSGAIYNPAMSTDSITRDNFAESCGIFDVDWPNDPDYVSWWPHVFISSMYLLRNTTTGNYANSLIVDCDSEGRDPDVTYDVNGLIEPDMRQAWHKFKYRCGYSSEYNLLKRNCSSAVWTVLKAGGIKNLLGKGLHQSMITHHKVWTPKNIAIVLNALNNKSAFVTKTKSETCRTKLQCLRATLLGLR